MAKQIHIDGSISTEKELASTASIAKRARELEELGYDGIGFAELAHDPFLPMAIAAHETKRVSLRTGIAVAFARNPMNAAVIAHDMNIYAQGRFAFGLGSQIKPHITRRFSMPWHGAAKQMREFIEAMRAIWDCWYDGTPLNYQGEFYQHSLMTPEFYHKSLEYGRPKILLAAVGPLMLKTAAAVADGLIVHPFCTEKYLKETILPTIEAELKANGKSLDTFEIVYPAFMATGDDDAQLERARHAVKHRIGFYSSTPAYKPVLAAHGWGDFQGHMNRMTKEGKWDQLANEVTDEMLETFAAVGPPAEVASKTKERFGGFIDRLTLDPNRSPDTLSQQMSILRG